MLAPVFVVAGITVVLGLLSLLWVWGVAQGADRSSTRPRTEDDADRWLEDHPETGPDDAVFEDWTDPAWVGCDITHKGIPYRSPIMASGRRPATESYAVVGAGRQLFASPEAVSEERLS